MTRVALFLLLLGCSPQAWAWGARGHSLVCETAAYLVSQESVNGQPSNFLKGQSFQLGYYCNVPDFIWKRPVTYKKEFTNHFMNLEAFDKKIKKSEWKSEKSPFRLSRKEFDKKYPNIPSSKGRSWWRIQELDKKLSGVSKKLMKKKLTPKDRHKLQSQWLLISGVMGHYVGDLAMPLHVSENYDGQLSGQEGLHHYFEEKMIRELYLTEDPGLQGLVYQRALKKWPEFLKKVKNKDLLSLTQELSLDSQSKVADLLALDKKMGRISLESSKKAYKELIIERFVQGSLHQAMVFYKHLGWKYDGTDFYEFIERPDFIPPPSS